MDITAIIGAIAGGIVTVLGAWYKINQSVTAKHNDLDDRYTLLIKTLSDRIDQLEQENTDLRKRIAELEKHDIQIPKG